MQVHIDAAQQALTPKGALKVNLQSAQIASPFSFLHPSFTKGSIQKVPTGNLSLKKHYLFPSEQTGTQAGEMVDSFFDRIQKLEPTAGSTYDEEEAMLSLMQYYLGTVAMEMEGISLFDYARLTAALAICLYQNEAEGYQGAPAYLVKGDISGIQSYIFDVVSDGAARSLKARSLRVQILSYLASDYILDELGLSPANRLYIGGGNFYLLIPGTKATYFEETVRARIHKETIKRRGFNIPIPEKLHVYLGAEPIPLEDFQKNFGSKWRAVDDRVDEARTQPYKTADFDDLFKPIAAVNQTTRRMAERDFFRAEIKNLSQKRGWQKVPTDGGQWIDKATYHDKADAMNPQKAFPYPYSYGKIAIRLPNAKEPIKSLSILFGDEERVWIEYEKSRSYLPKPFALIVRKLPTWTQANLDTWHHIVQEAEERKENRNTKPEDENDREYYPDSIISFEGLGLKAKARTGTDKLGILKMDIDNLGDLFQNRLADDKRSIAHTAAISRSLKWFFEGYMNDLLDKPLYQNLAFQFDHGVENHLEAYHEELAQYPNETFRDNLYVIFSGGDDFFLVGAWDIVMVFAWIVRQRFKEFTAGTATLSAGLVMVDPKYPVSRFADLVNEAEDSAKKYTDTFTKIYKEHNKDGKPTYPIKDRISVFDTVLSWEDYGEAMNLRAVLFHLITKEHKPEGRALIHKIKRYMEGFESLQKQILTSSSMDLQRTWRLKYYLRDVKDVNQDLVKEFILKRHQTLLEEMFLELGKKEGPRAIPPNAHLIAVGARWAEFMTKKDFKKNKQVSYGR
ncbi:MAG: type III-A CRISPR-associated protein Cas10/Csm1 [Bacteroidota bacterium]